MGNRRKVEGIGGTGNKEGSNFGWKKDRNLAFRSLRETQRWPGGSKLEIKMESSAEAIWLSRLETV